MNWIAAAAEWKLFRNEVRAHWPRLSGAQLEVVAGTRAHLAEQLRVSYGIARDEAERQICSFEERNDYLRPVSSR
jgi:hypothetical protein